MLNFGISQSVFRYINVELRYFIIERISVYINVELRNLIKRILVLMLILIKVSSSLGFFHRVIIPGRHDEVVKLCISIGKTSNVLNVGHRV